MSPTASEIRKGATQAAFNEWYFWMLMVEVFVIAAVVGWIFQSWWWFAGTMVGMFMVLPFKPLAIILAIALSVGWALIGYILGSMFGSQEAAIVLGILGFLSGLGAHWAGIQWAQDV